MSATNPLIRDAFATLVGEHRMEVVAVKDGITYINNSAATNVNAAWYALECMPEGKRVHWLVGGDGISGSSEAWMALRETARCKVKAVYDISFPAYKHVRYALAGYLETITGPYISLWHAVMAARAMAEPGEIVLLNPGCFGAGAQTDHKHRGELFKRAVGDI